MYECHITVSTDDGVTATTVATARGWKTSEIARDPLLGDAVHFYLTSHGKDYMQVYGKMNDTATELSSLGINVIRKKIELIVYDTEAGD